MGDNLGLDRDVSSMDDATLLLQEKEMYETWVRYTTKSVSTCAFGTVGAVLSLGLSLIVTVPFATSHVYNATYYSRQCILCSTEVKRRGLVSLPTDYGKIAGGVAATVSIGAACAAIPGADGVQEVVSAAVDYIPVDFVVDTLEAAAVAKVEFVAEAANSALECVAETTDSILPEPDAAIVDDTLSSLPLGSIEQELLQQTAQLAEMVADVLPELIEVSILTAGANGVFIGCESRVGVEFTRQSKKDLAKYLALQNEHLDDEAVRELVEKIHAKPVKFRTKFRNYPLQKLQQREVELMAAASKRALSLGWSVGAPLVLSVELKPVAALTQARGTQLLVYELRECQIELQQRKASSSFSHKLVAATTRCLDEATEQLQRFFVRSKSRACSGG